MLLPNVRRLLLCFVVRNPQPIPWSWARSRADVFHVYISIQLFNLSSLHLIQLAAQQGAKDLLLPQNTSHREIFQHITGIYLYCLRLYTTHKVLSYMLCHCSRIIIFIAYSFVHLVHFWSMQVSKIKIFGFLK